MKGENRMRPGENFISGVLIKIISGTDNYRVPYFTCCGSLPQNFNLRILTMGKTHDNGRRNFMKTMLAATAAGFFSKIVSRSQKELPETVKMLTADGQLVEVPKSRISKEIISTRATNEEVLEWMNLKHTPT